MSDEKTQDLTESAMRMRQERVERTVQEDREADARSAQEAIALIEDAEHDPDVATHHPEAPEYPGGGFAHDEDPDENPDPDYDLEDDGFFAMLWERKWWVVAAAAAVLVVLLLVRGIGGGGEAPQQAAPSPQAQAAGQTETQGRDRGDAPASAPSPGGEIKDTGVVIGEPVVKEDGTYYLRAGEIAWKGELKDTDTGEELTLEGPTAAQMKRSITLPQGSITTGVFGRAEPDKPILHATFHRVTAGEAENTTGTYKAIDDAGVIVDGSYEDVRDGKEIVRTYTEHTPGSQDYRSYRVRFEAPLGVPIPVLVGWEPPAEAEADEAA